MDRTLTIQLSATALAILEQKALAAGVSVADLAAVMLEQRLSETPCTELAELLDGITDENLHGEVDTGPAVGREVW